MSVEKGYREGEEHKGRGGGQGDEADRGEEGSKDGEEENVRSEPGEAARD